MNAAYFLRLACLSFAAFFLAHLALSGIVAAFAARAERLAERLPSEAGAALLFAMRMLPAIVAGFAVVTLCVPSYLWLEPANGHTEEIAWDCMTLAAAGVWVCVAGAGRGARLSARSARYLREHEAALENGAPVMLVAGIWRPRLVMSHAATTALTAQQLAVALRHEEAHGLARDNLKRLLMAMAPDPLPLVRGFGGLERAWARMAEWAADDHAVADDPQRALALAEALVRMARQGGAPATLLAISLLGDPGDLAARVNRLLEGAAPGRRVSVWPAVAFGACGAVLASQPVMLSAVYAALELLGH